MQRRHFLQSAGLGGAAALAMPPRVNALASSSPLKITRVRFYHNPKSPEHFNQSFNIVTVETDQGITGIGEGGSRETASQCAAMIIGEDPFRIDHLWQMMFRGYFYPAGREKLDALGAIDLALWDLKGKALGVPVYELLGGLARDHVECYSTGFPSHGSLKETARACLEAGFRAFRYATADPPDGQPFNSHQMVRKTYEDCVEVREGVGKDGDWALDYHTRLDFPDAVRPIAVGEQFGSRWDVNPLIEQQLIDYARVTLPNVGGITEYMKILALCETHYVGLIPHFTGPVSETALVHACGVFSGPVLMEMTGEGKASYPHLPECYDFRSGKMWPNRRPERLRPIPMFHRPDGSITNW